VFESRQEKDNLSCTETFHTGSEVQSTTYSMAIDIPYHWYEGAGRGVILTPHLHLVPRLRMSKAVCAPPIFLDAL
jgi:hypothetical protein